MHPEFAKQFAREWVEAWNDQDLDRVLAQYAEDFEMSSPFIRQIAGAASGRLKGKPACLLGEDAGADARVAV